MTWFSSLLVIARGKYNDKKGIPAYHFTFKLSDLDTSSTVFTITDAQGEAYLSVDGNYLLYFHQTFSGDVVSKQYENGRFPGTYEYTQELTAINQLGEITLPVDYPDFSLDLRLPLPEGTTFRSIYQHRPGEFFYTYDTGISKDDFINFYQNATPANGWTIVKVGIFNTSKICARGCAYLKRAGDPDGAEWLISWAPRIDETTLVLYYYPKGSRN